METQSLATDEATSAAVFDRFARFYDADYRDYTADIEAILDLASECGDPILELGCGTGRVLAPLAAAGHTITGVDISPALLNIARGKIRITREPSGRASDIRQAQSDHVTLIEADLRTFELPQKNFAFAFCTSNTLMHLTTQDDQLAVLRNAHRHLAEDGLLFIDLFNLDLQRLQTINGLQEFADQWEDEEIGIHVIKWSVRTVDWAEQLQETLFVYEEILPDGNVRKTVCPFTLRFLWRSEAELLLEKAGFTVDGVWGDFDGSPYEMSSEHLILLARK